MTLSLQNGYTKHVKSISEVPDGPHWVIIVFDSVSTWSGYKEDSGGSESVTRYYVYTDEKLWKDTLLELQHQRLTNKYGPPKEFVGLHVDKRAKLTTNIKVE